MLMKVHAKGQVIIPSSLRKALRIRIGDVIDVVLDNTKQIKLRRVHKLKSQELAGCFSEHAKKVKFPTPKQMHEALAKGITEEYSG